MHLNSFSHHGGSAALALALVEVILGSKARREITSFSSITMSGSLVPNLENFDTVVSDGAKYFVAPQHDRIGMMNLGLPKDLPSELRFRRFENLRDLICFAYDVRPASSQGSRRWKQS